MRNLKKILALVLALVMSLSLMATASATEFPDDGEIDDTYRVAVEVLSGLSVFAGDQNGKFNPKDPIRRSEVAAIIYRIATGDVTNERNNSYTPYNQFSDVITGDWFAGYVTYCANAGYIKGRNDGKFDPYANVTGYEVLAMILRAVGYDKNNEFVGSNWQLNTASIAQEKGVLKNITGATKLSEPATRETVAELLFRSILLPKVTWNANTLSYTDGTTPLATETLGLEEITGVVMANQWADLESGSVMADGKTRLKVDGKDYSIDYTSALTDIGESRHAYIQGSKVFVLDDTGSNVVKDNEGAETTVDALRGSLSIKDAEYFINFSDAEINESEWLIRYAVTVGTVDTAGNFLSYEPWYASTAGTLTSYGRYLNRELGDDYTLYTPATLPNINPVRRAAVETRDVTNADGSISRVLTVSIQPGAVINDFDQDLMRRIFYTADRFASNPTTSGSTVVNVDYYVRGEVYVGTTSLEDKSDIMSWNQFVDTYIKASPATKITAVGNGNWLKIIDNNNDGKAEYVLETRYTLDEVVNSATKDSTTTYYYRDLDIDAYKPVYLNDYSPAVGDIVLYARIDGTAQMHLADTSSTAFRAVNYKERQATDTDGKVWEQSDIYNKTLLPGDLTKVDENVTYTIYLDDYGYVRAYDNKTTYALVTEIYPTNTMNQAWLTGHALTAEVMTAEDGVVREYNLVNSWYANGWNPFYTANSWFYDGINDGWFINNQAVVGRPNYLRHATGGLDTTRPGTAFTYSSDPATTTWHPYSWTNVAKYTMTGDGINLTTAADYDQSTGSTMEDYVQLKVADAKPSNPLYEINDARWTGAGNDYVRAVDDTEFFVVAKDGIKHYTGYTKIPALTVSGNGIRAMYAVAEKVKSDLNEAEYWVANVIVIEMDHFSANWDSVALIYSNDYKISGDVKYLQALDSKRGDIGIIPNNWTWQGQFNNRGFYALSNVVATETEGLYRADVEQLYGASRARAVDPYANLSTTYGIHYGKVRSFNGELSRSSYITVDLYTGDDANGKHLYGGGANTTSIRLAADYGSVWGINGSVDRANTALDLILDYHANKQVQVGDEIVWVETSAGVAGFVVDLTDCDAGTFGTTYRDWWWTPEWLWDKDDNGIVTANCEVYYVMKDQIVKASADTVFGSFYGVEFGLDKDGNPTHGTVTVPYAQAKANKFELYENAGYTFTLNKEVKLTAERTVYTLTARKGSASYTFTLVQEAARGHELRVTGMIGAIDANNVITPKVRSNTTIQNFIDDVEKNHADLGATFYWHFVDEAGEEIRPDEYSVVHMEDENDVWAWTVSVWSEASDPAYKTDYTGSTTHSGDVDVAIIQVFPDEQDAITLETSPVVRKLTTGEYEIEVTAPQGSKPVAVTDNGKVYEMTEKAAPAARAAEEAVLVTFTVKVPASAVTKFIYIRMELSTDRPENPSTPSVTPVVQQAEGAEGIVSMTDATTGTTTTITVVTDAAHKPTVAGPAAEDVKISAAQKSEDGTQLTWTVTVSNVADGDTITVGTGDYTYKESYKVTLTLADSDEAAEITSENPVTVEEGADAVFTVTVSDTHELTIDSGSAGVADKKTGTVTITLANVTAETEIKATVAKVEKPAVEPNEQIQAIIDNGTYKFYSYQEKGEHATVSQPEAEAALIAAVAEANGIEDTTGASISMVGGTAIVTIGGKNYAAQYQATGANSMSAPAKLYAVTIGGSVAGYYPAGSADVPTTLAAGTRLLPSTTRATTTSSDAPSVASGTVAVTLSTADVELKEAVTIKVDWTDGWTTLEAFDEAATDWDTGITSGTAVYVQKGIRIRLTERTATTTGLTASVTVDGKALSQTAYTFNGVTGTAQKVIVNVDDLVAADDAAVADLTVSKVVNYKFIVDGAEISTIVTSGGKEYLEIGETMLDDHPRYVPIAKGSTPVLGYTNVSSVAQSTGLAGKTAEYLEITAGMKGAVHDDGYIYLGSLVKITFAKDSLDTPSGATVKTSWTKPGASEATAGADVGSIACNSGSADVYFVKGAALAFTANGTDKNIVETVGNGDDAVKKSVATVAYQGATAKATAYPVTVTATISLETIVRGPLTLTVDNFEHEGNSATKLSAVTVADAAALDFTSATKKYESGESVDNLTVVTTAASTDVAGDVVYRITYTGVALKSGFTTENLGTTVTVSGDAEAAGQCTITETASGVYTIVLIVTSTAEGA